MKTFSPLDILLIEDNPADAYLVEDMLHKSDLSISNLISTDTIENAIELIKQNRFHIALLDLSLPDSFGLESLHEIKHTNKKLPVIILTGNSDAEIALSALKEGAQDYLVKGEFNINILHRAINYSLERRAAIDALTESNDRYNIVAQLTNDVIWEYFPTTKKVCFVGPNIRQKFGFEFSDRAMDLEEANTIIHPLDKQRVLKSFFDSLERSNDATWEMEYRLKHREGYPVHILNKVYFNRQNGNAVKVIGTIRDLTDVKQLQKRIALSAIHAQEKERKHIGEELHDNVNQILSAVKLYLDLAQVDDEKKDELIRKSHDFTAKAISEIRKISRKLIAPEERVIDLSDMINNLVNDLQEGTSIQFNTDFSELNPSPLDYDQRIAVFRIIQEQLNNIIKYSGANNAWIKISSDAELLSIHIADNGKGADLKNQKAGVGLINIRSRAEIFNGKVFVETKPGEGFSLKVVMDITFDQA